jgi:hypothetical protein
MRKAENAPSGNERQASTPSAKREGETQEEHSGKNGVGFAHITLQETNYPRNFLKTE